MQGDSYLAAVDISHDGSRVVIGSSWPGQLEVIDAATGTRVLQVPGPEDSVVALAFAPDDRRFAVAFQGESSVRICNLATGTLSEPMLGHEASVKSIAWSPDGSTIVSAADRTVRTWDVAAGTARGAPWVHEQDITAVALNGDGRQVAVGTLAGEIHVHALDTGAELRVLAGAASRVLALQFAPKGSSLAAGYSDGSVRVFPADSSTPMELRGHEKRVPSLRYLPDGSRLVSGSFDGTLRVWATGHRQTGAHPARSHRAGHRSRRRRSRRAHRVDLARRHPADPQYAARVALTADGLRVVRRAGAGLRLGRWRRCRGGRSLQRIAGFTGALAVDRQARTPSGTSFAITTEKAPARSRTRFTAASVVGTTVGSAGISPRNTRPIQYLRSSLGVMP